MTTSEQYLNYSLSTNNLLPSNNRVLFVLFVILRGNTVLLEISWADELNVWE